MKLLNAIISFLHTEFTGAITVFVIAFFVALLPRVYVSSLNTTEVNYVVDSQQLGAILNHKSYDYSNYTPHYLNHVDYKRIYYPKSKWPPNKFVNDRGTNPKPNYTQNKPNEYKRKELVPIDINTADTNEFKQLRGIGSKLAGRIVKYRESLGGFIRVEQLKEVWGLDSNIIISQMHLLKIVNVATKIDINTCTQQQLETHPYIGKWNAQKLINYRKFHNPLSKSLLYKIGNIPAEKLDRFIPYLEF